MICNYLRETGKITVKAGYEFLQMDNGTLHFVLHPRDVLLPGGYATPPGITFVFSPIYGGSAEPHHRAMIFNMSVIRILANGEEYEGFKPLVYHSKARMNDAETVCREMNRCGAARRPFLFGVDFELRRGFFVEEPLRDKRLLFAVAT